ncbi:MAG: hypothetical protein KC609_26485 [Myxococcales bacterium]|nr:hypothetical protein [Myxococcales bacterium]
MELQLSPEDRKNARTIMARCGFRNVYLDRDVEVLLNWWVDFVNESTSTLWIDRESFVEDLGIRSAIQVLLDGLRNRVSTAMAAQIAEADERYRSAPRREEGFLLDAKLLAQYPQEIYFWLYGVPETVQFTE